MASSGWQGYKDFPYFSTELKCDLNITSITHSGTNLRVTGQVGARNISSYYSYYSYPVYVTPGNGGQQTLLSGGERVTGGSIKTVNFDVTIPNVSASTTSYSFPVYINMNNGTAVATLYWTISFSSSVVVTPPSGLNIPNIVSRAYNSFTVNTVVASWGNGVNSYRVFKVLESPYEANVSALGKQSYSNSTGNVPLTVGTNDYDNLVGTAFAIKGAGDYYLGLYADNEAGSTRYAESAVRHTPPAPLASITVAQTPSQTANVVTHTATITGGGSTYNNANNVTTYYRYSNDAGATYSNWTAIGNPATPWTSKTISFTSEYGRGIIIQAKQTYYEFESEVKSYAYNATVPVAPSTPSVSIVSIGARSATFRVSTASYGTPSSHPGRYIEAAILTENNYMVDRRRFAQALETLSSNITVNNSSIGGVDPLTIVPNTTYWYGGFAENQLESTSTVVGTFTTKPDILASLNLSSQTIANDSVTATISWTSSAEDGGASTETVKYQYSVNGGSYTALTTAGNFNTPSSTGTFSISGLPYGATVTVLALVTNSTGNSTTKTLSFVTQAKPHRLYGSVSGRSKAIQKLYGSVNGRSKKIVKLYGSVNGRSRRIF